jgi:LIM domain
MGKWDYATVGQHIEHSVGSYPALYSSTSGPTAASLRRDPPSVKTHPSLPQWPGAPDFPPAVVGSGDVRGPPSQPLSRPPFCSESTVSVPVYHRSSQSVAPAAHPFYQYTPAASSPAHPLPASTYTASSASYYPQTQQGTPSAPLPQQQYAYSADYRANVPDGQTCTSVAPATYAWSQRAPYPYPYTHHPGSTPTSTYAQPACSYDLPRFTSLSSASRSTRRPLPSPPVKRLNENGFSSYPSVLPRTPATGPYSQAQASVSTAGSVPVALDRSSTLPHAASSSRGSAMRGPKDLVSDGASNALTTEDRKSPQPAVGEIHERLEAIELSDSETTKEIGFSMSRPCPPRVSAPVPPLQASVPTIALPDGDESDDCDVAAKASVDIPSISLPGDNEQPVVGDSEPSPVDREKPAVSVTSVSLSSLADERASQPTMTSLSSSLVCAGCSLPIAGRILSTMKRRWHPECFVCSHAECDENLEHVAFHESAGRPWCHFHYHEVRIPMFP